VLGERKEGVRVTITVVLEIVGEVEEHEGGDSDTHILLSITVVLYCSCNLDLGTVRATSNLVYTHLHCRPVLSHSHQNPFLFA